jgi:hypothetical protein
MLLPIPTRIVAVKFWGSNSTKPTIRSAGWFWGPNHQIITSVVPRTHHPRHRHVSRLSSIAPVIRTAPPCPHASACPRCQPWLVTRLLWSVSQDPSLVLHSQFISTGPHDIHLNRWPSSLCSTPAHHKPTDMVAHTHNSRIGQSSTQPDTLPVDIHSSSNRTKRDKSTLCS